MKSLMQQIDNSTSSDLHGWYAVHTHAKQEGRAESNLRAWQVETFYPRLKEYRKAPYSNVLVAVTKPFFPSYIFARFDAARLLHKICFTRGVRSVVSFGNGPALIDDQIISLLRSKIMKDGLIETEKRFTKGSRVQVIDGPLKSLEGIFEQEMKGTSRVMILLDAIKYQSSVVVDSSQVKIAS